MEGVTQYNNKKTRKKKFEFIRPNSVVELLD